MNSLCIVVYLKCFIFKNKSKNKLKKIKNKNKELK